MDDDPRSDSRSLLIVIGVVAVLLAILVPHFVFGWWRWPWVNQAVHPLGVDGRPRRPAHLSTTPAGSHVLGREGGQEFSDVSRPDVAAPRNGKVPLVIEDENLTVRRMATRVFLGIVIAALACTNARPACGANWVFSNIIPPWGHFDVTISDTLFSTTVIVSTTDTDEAVKTASVNNATALLGHSSFSIVTGDGGHPAFSLPPVARNPSGQTTPLVGDVITAERFELYDGNWALGIGLSDETGLKAFIEFREAGSTATVLDSSLATQAVAKGLWSSVSDYFEFETSLHATINPLDPTPNGPGDYFGQTLPEPASATIVSSLSPLLLLLHRKATGHPVVASLLCCPVDPGRASCPGRALPVASSPLASRL